MLVSRIVIKWRIVFPTAGDSRLGHLSRERKGNVLIARPASEPESRSLEMSVMVNVIKWHGSQAPVFRTLNQVHCHHILSEMAWTDINMVQYTLHMDCRKNVWVPIQFIWKSCVVVGLPMSTTGTDSYFFLETWPGATFSREWTNDITCTTGTIDNDPRKSSSHHPSWKSGIFAEILRHLTLDVINKGVFLRIRPREDTS